MNYEGTRPCASCGNPTKDPNRKLCWRCTSYKQRHNLSWKEVCQDRAIANRLCFVCNNVAHYGTIRIDLKSGKQLCPGCFKMIKRVERYKNQLCHLGIVYDTGNVTVTENPSKSIRVNDLAGLLVDLLK